MAEKLNKFQTGLIFGLIGPVIGFLIYGFYYAVNFRVSLSYFINYVFLGTKGYQSPIASLSLLFNLITFLLFLRFNLEEGARGILMGTAIYVPLVIFLFFY